MATKASKRIYRVELSDESGAVIPTRLVRASHPRIALAHVVRPIASVSLVSQDELVALLTDRDSPVTVEDADDEQEPAEPKPRATELPKVEWPIPHPGGDWPKPKTGEAA